MNASTRPRSVRIPLVLACVFAAGVASVALGQSVTHLTPLAAYGQYLPGSTTETFGGFSTPYISRAGQVVFWSETTRGNAIWKWTEGSGLQLIVEDGPYAAANLPWGTSSIRLELLATVPSINPAGDVAFIGKKGEGEYGLWVWRAGASEFELIVRSGDSLPELGTGVLVSPVAFWNDRAYLTDAGDVLFCAAFQDGNTPPTVSGAGVWLCDASSHEFSHVIHDGAIPPDPPSGDPSTAVVTFIRAVDMNRYGVVAVLADVDTYQAVFSGDPRVGISRIEDNIGSSPEKALNEGITISANDTVSINRALNDCTGETPWSFNVARAGGGADIAAAGAAAPGTNTSFYGFVDSPGGVMFQNGIATFDVGDRLLFAAQLRHHEADGCDGGVGGYGAWYHGTTTTLLCRDGDTIFNSPSTGAVSRTFHQFLPSGPIGLANLGLGALTADVCHTSISCDSLDHGVFWVDARSFRPLRWRVILEGETVAFSFGGSTVTRTVNGVDFGLNLWHPMHDGGEHGYGLISDCGRVTVHLSFDGGSGAPTSGVFYFKPRLRSDWDGNGATEPADISLFVSDWYADLANSTTNADFDASNTTDSADLAAFVTYWYEVVAFGC